MMQQTEEATKILTKRIQIQRQEYEP